MNSETPNSKTSKKTTQLTGNPEKPFLSDVQELRRRARAHMECGPVTDEYGGDIETIIKLLNEALATEIVCTLRYRHHYFAAQGINASSVADEFLEHSNEEQEHADWLADRINQLGGNPNLNPEGLLTRAHSEYSGTEKDTSLIEMIQEDLYAERIAIESYTEIIRFIGSTDPTSRRIFERILEVEEEHADDMAKLLVRLDPKRQTKAA